MSIHTQIKLDAVTALKAKDTKKREALSFILSALNNVAKEEKVVTLDDNNVIRLLQKQLKQRKEAFDGAHQAGREELCAAATFEMNIIQSYMPQRLSADETETLARKVIADLNATSMKQMGQVMNELAKVAPAADKSQLSSLVKSLLSK